MKKKIMTIVMVISLILISFFVLQACATKGVDSDTKKIEETIHRKI